MENHCSVRACVVRVAMEGIRGPVEGGFVGLFVFAGSIALCAAST